MGQALWFASRGTGLVSLLLLTGTVVLGAAHSGRGRLGGWPRFTVQAVHRNLSLLGIAFVAVHVATSIIDPYAGITWLDAVVPFVSVYKPLWLGLGTVALDLMLAVLITSALRGTVLGMSVSPRVWRAVHLSSYALWPLAVAHGLGTGGADSELPWVLGLNIVCMGAVAAAVTHRVLSRHPDADARRAAEAGHR